MAVSRFKFVRVGTMSYEVYDRDGYAFPGNPVGLLWRTRDGWRGRTPSGRLVEYFGISRDTAAGCLSREDA